MRGRRPFERLERPVTPIFVRHLHRLFAARLGDERLVIRRTEVDPCCKLCDGGDREFVPFGRHDGFVKMGDEANEPAGFGMSNHDNQALIAAFKQTFACAEIEAAARLLAAVAAQTVIGQKLADRLRKNLLTASHFRGVVRRNGRRAMHRRREAKDA